MSHYYGFLGRFTAASGAGPRLTKTLLAAAEGLRANADCLVYVISSSPDNADEITVMEVWTSKEAHDASLQDAAVLAAIAQARPLIASVSGTPLDTLDGKGI